MQHRESYGMLDRMYAKTLGRAQKQERARRK
jgi:hypothetical protein